MLAPSSTAPPPRNGPLLTLIGENQDFLARPGPDVYVIEDGALSDIQVERLGALTALTSLDLDNNGIGDVGARAILDTWADAETASRKSYLSLSENQNIGSALPAEIFGTTDAQEFLAA
jgi:hypothetical protein